MPFPLNEGGTIGIYNYLKGYHEANLDVTLLALAAKKHNLDFEAAKTELSKFAKIHLHPIDTDVKLWPAFKNIFNNRSYNVDRFYNQQFDNLIKNKLESERFDIIKVEGTYAAVYTNTILKYSKPESIKILRQHNVEAQIWFRLSNNSSNPIKKWYFDFLAKRIKTFAKMLSAVIYTSYNRPYMKK